MRILDVVIQPFSRVPSLWILLGAGLLLCGILVGTVFLAVSQFRRPANKEAEVEKLPPEHL